MTIKITKPAPEHFSATCPKCSCQFRYALEDTHHQYVPWSGQYVFCPTCTESIRHA